jgi:hypothetical protein
MVREIHKIASVRGGAEYNGGPIASNGELRVAPPITNDRQVERLLDIAISMPHLAPFSVVNSYAESLERVGLKRVVFEAQELMRLHAGGLPLWCFSWDCWVHRRTNGCDAHTIAVPLDLASGRVLPLFVRDKTMVQLVEKTCRMWDLEQGRSSPQDWWRRSDLHNPTPRKLDLAEEIKWFRSTDDHIADWIRAGMITDRAGVLKALADAGAIVGEDKYFPHIVATYGKKTFSLRRGKYSRRFSFDTLGGRAGQVPERDPAASAAEIDQIGRELPRLRSEREAVFARFRRKPSLGIPRGFSQRLAQYLPAYVGGLEGLARSHDDRDLGPVERVAPGDGRYPSEMAMGGGVRTDRPGLLGNDRPDLSQGSGIRGNAGQLGHARPDDRDAARRAQEGGRRNEPTASLLRKGRVDLDPNHLGYTAGKQLSPGADVHQPTQAQALTPAVPAADDAASMADLWLSHFLAAEKQRIKDDYERTERKRRIGESLARSNADMRRATDYIRENPRTVATPRATDPSLGAGSHAATRNDRTTADRDRSARRPVDGIGKDEPIPRSRIATLVAEFAATRTYSLRAFAALEAEAVAHLQTQAPTAASHPLRQSFPPMPMEMQM